MRALHRGYGVPVLSEAGSRFFTPVSAQNIVHVRFTHGDATRVQKRGCVCGGDAQLISPVRASDRNVRHAGERDAVLIVEGDVWTDHFFFALRNKKKSARRRGNSAWGGAGRRPQQYKSTLRMNNDSTVSQINLDNKHA